MAETADAAGAAATAAAATEAKMVAAAVAMAAAAAEVTGHHGNANKRSSCSDGRTRHGGPKNSGSHRQPRSRQRRRQ